MIFLTVGTQLPFDRLVRAVDEWAGESADRPPVVAQIGPSAYRPAHLTWATTMSPAECRAHMAAAAAVVAHAGMGTIIGALELGKPVLVMPRRAELREHRNDHQLATARRLAALGHVRVAADARELRERLDGLESLSAEPRVGARDSDELIRALALFIEGDGRTRVGFGRLFVRARH